MNKRKRGKKELDKIDPRCMTITTFLQDILKENGVLHLIVEYEKLTLEQAEWMCKSRIKDEYLLTDIEVLALPHRSVRNPHGARSPNMILVTVFEAESAAIKKFGSISDLLTAKLDLSLKQADKKERRETKKQDKIQKRTAKLEEALEERGLQLRGDSRLCQAFIEGKKTKPLNTICDIMEEMHFYFNSTDYEKILDKARTDFDEECEELLSKKRDRWISLPRWEFEEESDSAKHFALEQYLLKHSNKLDDLPKSLHPLAISLTKKNK